jgi:hypothetical protein
MGEERRGDRAAHAIYGSIVVLAVIVAESGHGYTAAEALVSVVAAALVTAVAESYADYIGATISHRRHPSGEERGLYLGDIAVGFLTALGPGIFFVLAAAGTISLSTAFDAAIWAGIAIIAAYAVFANRVAGASLGGSLLAGLTFALVGAALVALKALA